MERLGEIFAKNMKEYRRKSGLTQEKLAEKVDVSTHHIGMIEIARSFPTLDLVQRIAGALNIESYRLFMESYSTDEKLERLRQEIKGDMKQLLDEYFEKNLVDPRK
ncbi:MAG: helix-turn-helix transcriptional regulator [Spirochaetaceae bacterium]|jgi:transcriptional regulator with XRE-family HTH domain|nr:helix-turn-helix transcriptional regulator [Spirochaetaceae bacterium]